LTFSFCQNKPHVIHSPLSQSNNILITVTFRQPLQLAKVSSAVLTIIDLHNIAILAAEQTHQPLIIHLQTDQHLIHAHVGTQILLHQLIHLVSLLFEVLAGDGDPDLLALYQVLFEALLLDEGEGQLGVGDLLVDALEDAVDLAHPHQFEEVDFGHQFAVALDYFRERGNPVELQVQAQNLLLADLFSLALRHRLSDILQKMVFAGLVLGQKRQGLGGQNVDVVDVEHVQNEDQSSLHCLVIELFDFGLFFVRVQPANFLETVNALIRVEEQPSAKLAFDPFDLVIGKDSDGD
jgi:hypothetical protein